MTEQQYGFLGDSTDIAERVSALRKVPLFEDMDVEYLHGIARHCEQKDVDAGAVLVEQGEPGHELIVIMSGAARVERDGQTIARLGAGNYVGEMALLDGSSRSATVVADGPTRVISLSHRIFDSLLSDVKGLERKLLLNLAARLRARDNPLE